MMFLAYKNCGFRELCTRFAEGCAKFSSLSGVLVQKQAFQKGDGSHPLFQFFDLVVVGGCYY